jgi:hypothetical protein
MRFDAPWCKLLVIVSIFATSVCLLAAWAAWSATTRAGGDTSLWWASLLPVVIILAAALYTVRGYSVERDSILVHRLLWATRLQRTGLRSAVHDPSLISGGIRVFGNGGFFSFSGWFRNKALGTYRAYITDPSLAVVLRYGDKTIVLSPSDPDRFIAAVAPDAT